MTSIPGRSERWLLATVLLAGFALNAYHARWGLPGRWHPDEVASLAMKLVRQRSLAPGFYAYPSLHVYTLLSVVVLPFLLVKMALNVLAHLRPLAGIFPGLWTHAPAIFLCSRLLSALMGALTILTTWLTARRLLGPRGALGAALIVALAAGMIANAHFATVDVPAVFWMMLAVWRCQVALERDTARAYLVAGLLVGLAASTKYPNALLGIPLLLAAGVNMARRSGPPVGRGGAGAKLLAVTAAPLLGFFLGTPYALLDAPGFLGDVIRLAFSQPAYAGSGALGYLPHLDNLREMLGPFAFALCLAGFALLAARAWRTRSAAIALLLLTIVLFYLGMGAMRFHPSRYVLMLVPLLAICGGAFVDLILDPSALKSVRARRGAVALVAVSLLFSLFYALEMARAFAGDDRYRAQEWLERHVPKDASLEVSALYAPNVPGSYTHVGELPFLHRKETFRLMADNPAYRRMARLLPFARLADAADSATPVEPASAGLEALLRRRPDYLVLSAACYGRFLSTATSDAVTFPLQSRMYRAIFSGATPYRLVADFRREDRWWRPTTEFVDAGVTIHRWIGEVGSAGGSGR